MKHGSKSPFVVKHGSKSPASLSEVFGEKCAVSISIFFRHLLCLVFVTLFLFACASAFSQVASELLTCASEPQRQTRQTQTGKTAPPRDTEKTVKSDATETNDTKLLHAKFLTRKFQCNEVSLMLKVLFRPNKHPTSKIKLQTHPCPTSDSQCLHEFPRFLTQLQF